jgi:hypothetical protein
MIYTFLSFNYSIDLLSVFLIFYSLFVRANSIKSHVKYRLMTIIIYNQSVIVIGY